MGVREERHPEKELTKDGKEGKEGKGSGETGASSVFKKQLQFILYKKNRR